jgi:hypothetical protein
MIGVFTNGRGTTCGIHRDDLFLWGGVFGYSDSIVVLKYGDGMGCELKNRSHVAVCICWGGDRTLTLTLTLTTDLHAKQPTLLHAPSFSFPFSFWEISTSVNQDDVRPRDDNEAGRKGRRKWYNKDVRC